MTVQEFNKIMDHVVASLKREGYNPEEQLTGYVMTGDDRYITRKDGARDAVKLLDKSDIQKYLNHRSE